MHRRTGQARSSDGRLDVKLSVPGTYTPATLTHKPPQGNNAKCGTACHMIAKGKDYVFTEYAKR